MFRLAFLFLIAFSFQLAAAQTPGEIHGRIRAALADRSCVSGYGSTGIEFQAGRTAARIEARDNVFCYRSPLAGVKSATRNDVNFSFGLAYHFR